MFTQTGFVSSAHDRGEREMRQIMRGVPGGGALMDAGDHGTGACGRRRRGVPGHDLLDRAAGLKITACVTRCVDCKL